MLGSCFQKKSFDSLTVKTKASGLVRNLGSVDVLLLGLGSIIGSGLFVFTGLVAAEYAGPAVMISYLLAGITAIFIALAYTELATMIPTSGGLYSYSYLVLGELIAWVMACSVFLEFTFAAASIATGWSGYFKNILSVYGMYLPHSIAYGPLEGGVCDVFALLIVLLLGSILFFGIKSSKKINLVLVFIKLGTILIFVVVSSKYFNIEYWSSNFMPFGIDNVIRGSAVLFLSFNGYGLLASTAEECKNPNINISVGIVGAVVISIMIYVVVGGLLTGITHYENLNASEALASVLKVKGSRVASSVISFGVIIGMITGILVNIYAVSRILYVVSRDGLLPKIISFVHCKYHTPYVALYIVVSFTMLISAIMPCKFFGQLSGMFSLFNDMVVMIIVILLRIVKADYKRVFKCPILFIVAPIGFLSAGYLLLQQIYDKKSLISNNAWILFTCIISAALIYYIAYNNKIKL
ncbi:amino acid permease [Rickettsia endosymbiont of Cardiosporidium cionae]|uniref:amino acid permease n=1 Tax=Rickettsia endosymbiont of Cardiosporidium cionae TaxID=2777155 RepID=UPI001895A975|nr:amino acid permease [Rickettsia endosymbiont of Cardiosporidium cionae]KAF8818484.1 amino acid permease [Rickettsia endosymbiont of Cardiosporidium cionae]